MFTPKVTWEKRPEKILYLNFEVDIVFDEDLDDVSVSILWGRLQGRVSSKHSIGLHNSKQLINKIYLLTCKFQNIFLQTLYYLPLIFLLKIVLKKFMHFFLLSNRQLDFNVLSFL